MTETLRLWSGISDDRVARAAAGGDRQAFAELYERYAQPCYDYRPGLLGDRDTADDCELGRPAADASGGPSDCDRDLLELLELSYRDGLDGPELAAALGISLANANNMVCRLRQTVERCLRPPIVACAARGRNVCPELAAVLKGGDGDFTVLMRKRIARHIQSCESCVGERHRPVVPVEIQCAATVFIQAPAWLRSRTLGAARLTSATSDLPGATSPHHGPRRVGSYFSPPRVDPLRQAQVGSGVCASAIGGRPKSSG